MNNSNQRLKSNIRILGILLTGLLIFFEHTLNLNSFAKQGFKIVLLGLIPLLVIYFYKKSTIQIEYNLNKVKILDLKIPVLVGVIIYILTIIGYIIFKPIIDTETLINGLQDNGINLQNIVLASLYLCFINSFIEEFFFRGFLYQHFSEISNKLGYLVSSVLFSIYHVLLMFAIFNWTMGTLALFGLTIVGIVLVYINKSNRSIINSWIVHVFADLGIVTIGLYLFMQ